ncbi:membrane protein [PinkBerry-associated phage LS06-2018-MD08]|nr:membrane protein [PinkBerry-associated phage LS06-2018-MD08]
MKEALKHMDSIIRETQEVFDTYMKKFGQFSSMTRSVYISLCEQYRVYDLLKEKFEEES